MKKKPNLQQKRELEIYTTIQMCADAALMAANDVFHCGPGRAGMFIESMSEYIGLITKLIREDTPDLEYSWTVIDRRLAEVVGQNNLVPHEERYKP